MQDPQANRPDRGSASGLEVFRALRRRRHPAAAVFVASIAVGALWIASVESVYRASATLLLETERGGGGVLSELAALTSPPAAAAEIAVLRSRSLAAATVAHPVEPGLVDDAPGARRLALDLLVDDLRRTPFASTLARIGLAEAPAGRVRARLLAAERGSPEELRLTVHADGAIELVPVGRFGASGAPARVEPRADRSVEAFGWKLLLDHDDAAVGGTFRLRRLEPEIAVRRVQAATRVVETQRNSGVLELSVSDTDPRRAAAIANALCANYFDRDVARGRRRASETVDFIRSQLATQQEALAAAEREVVGLQRSHPDLIDRASSARELVRASSEFAVRRLELELVERNLTEALAVLADGRVDALSRLGSALADPLAQSLVEQLAALELERTGVERIGGGRADARPALLDHARTAAARAAELELQVRALADLIERVRLGDVGGLALLGQAPDAGVLADPLTLGLVAELARVDGEIERLAAAYTPLHPELARARTGREELLRRITDNLVARLGGLGELLASRRDLAARADHEVENAFAGARELLDAALVDLRERTQRHLLARREALRTERAELGRIAGEIDERLGALPEKERALADPLRRLETHKELTAFLLRSLQEAEIARASALASADYIDPAIVPDRRYSPRVGVGLAFAALVGMACAVALALALERVRASLRGSRELEACAGLPVLGTIPMFERRIRSARPFLPLRDAPQGPLAEAYRSLRANLRFAVGDLARIRTLAVTSCAPGEGKSTTNVDLAWVLAGAGRRVLLVDGDLRRPSVHRYLELSPGPGLAEVLHDDADWRPLVQRTHQAGLDVLVAGRHRGPAGELLSGARAAAVVAELSAEYDLVVFDLPPVLVVSDVESFAHRLDALLLLYREDGLPRQAVESAVRRLRQAGARLVGAVLNASRASVAEGGGDYGNAYGAHYYASESAPALLPAREPAATAAAHAADES